jgi:hypothetical protein
MKNPKKSQKEKKIPCRLKWVKISSFGSLFALNLMNSKDSA